jgi:parvulin-like peptidyl-prolyl isomerase
MISGRFRRAAAVVFVVVCAAAAASCNSTSSDAATVTYTDTSGAHTIHITTNELLTQVKQLQDTKQFKAVLLQAQPPLANATTNDTANSTLTAQWLAQLIDQAVVDAQFKSQGLQVTGAVRTAALTDLQQRFSADAYNAFPKTLQDSLLTGDAHLLALLSSCPSGRELSLILVRTQADAEGVFNQIAKGGDFSKLAQQYSLDTNAKQNGGIYGCLYPGELPTEAQAAAEQVPFDTVTVPVKTSSGYFLILVRKWDPQAVTSNQTLAQSAQQAATAVLDQRLQGIHVWVNPQFGTWSSVASQSGGRTYTVVPPQAPSPRTQREKPPVTTTPTT